MQLQMKNTVQLWPERLFFNLSHLACDQAYLERVEVVPYLVQMLPVAIGKGDQRGEMCIGLHTDYYTTTFILFNSPYPYREKQAKSPVILTITGGSVIGPLDNQEYKNLVYFSTEAPKLKLKPGSYYSTMIARIYQEYEALSQSMKLTETKIIPIDQVQKLRPLVGANTIGAY